MKLHTIKSSDFKMKPMYLLCNTGYIYFKVTINKVTITPSTITILLNYEEVKLDNSLNSRGRVWINILYDNFTGNIRLNTKNYASAEEAISTMKGILTEHRAVITENEYEAKKNTLKLISTYINSLLPPSKG